MELLRKYVTMIRADLRQIMKSRCGLDELNNLLMLIGFLYIVAALVSHKWIYTLIGTFFVVICYMRVFSKNLEKRRHENDIYMRYMGTVVRWVGRYKLKAKMALRTRKDEEYAYFVCNGCGQVIRVPKGKHKVSIRCPKCNETFIKTT